MNNRYTIHNKIGQGGMGVVYRATDRLTGEIVALKQIHMPTKHLELVSSLDTATDRALRVALAQEFQILAGLRHPHIISVLDYGFDAEQQPFFTMTYLPDSQTILEAGSELDTAGKISLIQQILQALAYLHRHGIIHRDLKPSNVLVNAQMVQVLDFGLSFRGDASHISPGGSVRYMAPELLRREKASKISDLYAVGVMAYELLAGRHPFDVTSGEFAKQVQEAEPDLSLLGLDDALTTIIGRLLAKGSQDRYSRARVSLNAISEALGETVQMESATIRESYLQAAAFVGREAEMAQLEAALTAEAQEGQGAVWLISGESGVGKTRLLDEFRAHALVAGWQVITGQAVAEGGVPYQLWRDVVPHLVLNCDLSDLEVGVLRQVAPTIDRLLQREIPEPPLLNGKAAQERLVLTLIDVLQRQTQPTLLLLEDLQWAYESLAPLKQILNVIDQLPQVVVIGTYRNDERPELPQELSGAQHLLLERLSNAQIEALSHAILGEGASTPQVVSLVAQETEGNTFFIVEVLRALAEEAGQLAVIGKTALPTGILTSGMQRLLQRRIQRVPVADQELLQLAAVAGRQVDVQVLQALAQNKDIDGWLQRVAETTVFTVRDGQWQFAHDKLREAILSKLTVQERQLLNRQIAESIEKIYPEDESYYQVLLEYWHQAGDFGKEMQYLPTVAQNLIEFAANYVYARELLERGLKPLPANDGRRVSLLNWEATSCLRQSNFDRASSLSQQARKLARKMGDQAGEAISLNNLGNVAFDQGEYKQARDYYQQSLAIQQAIGDQRGVGNSFNNLGNVAFDQGEYKQARDYYQQSLAIQQAIGDQRGIGNSLNNLGVVALSQGDYEQARDYYQQSLAIRQAIGDQRGMGNSLNNLGLIALSQGDNEQARDYHQQSLAIKQAIGDQRGIGNSLNSLGELFYYQGKYEQARDYYEQSIGIRRAIKDKYGLADSITHLGFLYLQYRDVQAGISFRDALAISHAIQSTMVILEAVVGFAWLYLQGGNLSRAAELAGLVQHHLASDISVQMRLDAFLPLLKEALPAAELQAAMERGKALDLDTVVETLLNEFSKVSV